MRLRELCTATQMAKRTVHFYIKEGLITPETDPENGYYEFDQTHVEQLLLIRELRKARLTLKDIRSILTTPMTAAYYLNLHMEKLRKEIRYMEQTIHSLRYVLDTLSLNPGFKEVTAAVAAAGIPTPPEEMPDTGAGEVDMRFINHFLWRGFLQEEHLSEYQEFLWHKLEQLAKQDVTGNYRIISRYLHGMHHEEIDRSYAQRNMHVVKVAKLEEKEIRAYSLNQIETIRDFLKNQNHINYWHDHYETFHLPYIIIGTSKEEARLLQEISPMFSRYLENIRKANLMTYEYLYSEEGKELLAKMESIFKDHLDLEIGDHAQIEYLCSCHAVIPSFVV